MKTIKYVEPDEYMPKEIRDRFFPKTAETAKPAKTKNSSKRTVKRKTGK